MVELRGECVGGENGWSEGCRQMGRGGGSGRERNDGSGPKEGGKDDAAGGRKGKAARIKDVCGCDGCVGRRQIRRSARGGREAGVQ